MKKEDKISLEAIRAARIVQTFLWGEANGDWGIEEWRRMFRKRIRKIDDIDPQKPHAIVEFKKRLLQNAALSIALIRILDEIGIKAINREGKFELNLPEFAEKTESQKAARTRIDPSSVFSDLQRR